MPKDRTKAIIIDVLLNGLADIVVNSVGRLFFIKGLLYVKLLICFLDFYPIQIYSVWVEGLEG